MGHATTFVAHGGDTEDVAALCFVKVDGRER